MAELEIPQRSGAVVCVPPGPALLDAARANAEDLDAPGLRVAGSPLGEFRAQTKRRMLASAQAFTRAAGIPLTAHTGDGPLVVTGHQPFFFHPGIWIKLLLVDRLARMGAAGISMPVDSDACEELGMDVPSLDGRLRRVRETLVAAADDVPYESQPAPSSPAWEAFAARVQSRLATLPHEDVGRIFAEFVRGVPVPGGRSIGEWITTARRGYEGPRGYFELPVSVMSATEEFRRFALQIIGDAERFAGIYNRHLRAYRGRAGIRTAAQPFPDLDTVEDCVELPFWIVREGRRLPLYVRRSGGVHQLMTGAVEIAALDRLSPERLDGLAIRPRALTLTAFTRLCVADLFVHGIGGGRYDRVTDAVIRDYFGIAPPAYAVVTATLHLPLRAEETGAEVQQLRRRLLELQHNPERILDAPSPAQRELIEEKWKLIGQLDGQTLPRRERREATRRIRNINEMLAAGLDAERVAVEQRLAAVSDAAASEPAATARTYPFCFFTPQTVDELVAAQFEERVHGR